MPTRSIALAGAFSLLLLASAVAQAPEAVYRGELLTFPGAWSYQIRSSGIILTTVLARIRRAA